MSKVRINDLARELEVKSRSILDALTAVGVTEAKTHSSSIEADEAEKVRGYIKGRRASTPSANAGNSGRRRCASRNPVAIDDRHSRIGAHSSI